MLATLQFIVRYVLILSTIIGLVFIVACTIFVIACVIHGDIKINITRKGTEKRNRVYRNVEVYSRCELFSYLLI